MYPTQAVLRFVPIVVAAVVSLSGCDNGGSPADPQSPPVTPGVTIHGTVSKGPLDASDIELLPIDAFGVASGAAVATATTAADGSFVATIPAGSGALLIRSSGGSYTDEADRADSPGKRRIQLGQGEGLESLLPAGETTATVSIATQALLDKSRRETTAGTFLQQFEANRALATTAIGFDIVTTAPADPVSPDPALSVSQRQYAMLLGGLANLVNRIAIDVGLTAPTIESILAAATDFSDGRVDGFVAGTPVMAAGSVIGVFSLNQEIARFRNNNFDAYANTPLLVVDENVYSQSGVPVNTAPVAAADNYQLVAGTTLVVAAPGVLINDTDADSNPLTAQLVGPDPGNATAFNFSDDGAFSYTHNGTAPGTETFTYLASDGLSDSAPVSVTLTVTAIPNRPPVAVDDAYTVSEGGSLNDNALSNDTDADNDPLTAMLIDNVQNGQLVLNTDGTFSYTHDGSETTSDSFSYVANDGSDNSNAGNVVITVTPVNDEPVGNPETLTVDEGASTTVLTSGAASVLANDTDAENDPLVAVLQDTTGNGVLNLNPDGTFSYTHDSSETTSDFFIYIPSDGDPVGSTPVRVDIVVNPVNDAPVAVVDSLTVDEGGTQTVLDSGNASVLDNDSDPEMDALTASVVVQPVNGLLVLNPDGTISYEHDGGETTSDQFEYVANDGSVDSLQVTVSIFVTAVNDQPTTTGIANVFVDVNAADSVIDLFATFDDAEDADNVLIYNVDDNSNNNLVTPVIDSQAGTLTLVYSQDIFGFSDITVSATDTGNPSLSVATSFSVFVNGLPRATDDAGSGFETTQDVEFTTASVLTNDELGDQPTSITAFDNPSAMGAVVNIAGTGTFLYTPPPGFTDLDAFTYTITDNNGDSSVGTVTVSVLAPGNQAPTAISLDNASVDEEQQPGVLVGNLTTTDPDLNDTHIYTLVSGTGDDDNASFTINGGQLLTGETLDFESTPVLSVRVRTDDQNGGLFEEAFTISVNDLAETITWIVADDGDWEEPSNWSPPGPPMPNDTVIIDLPGAIPTITLSSNADVVSIECADNLVIAPGASLSVHAFSTLSGTTTLSPGATLAVEGLDGSFTVSGTLQLEGGELRAENTAQLILQTLESYSTLNDSTWRAVGMQSRISFPGLTEIFVGEAGVATADPELDIEALDGGTIDLPALTSMLVADNGLDTVIDIDVLATSGGAVLMPQLMNFTDTDASGNVAGTSSLTAQAGGLIAIPQLTAAQQVSLSIDAGSQIDIVQLSLLIDAVLTLDTDSFAFPNLNALLGMTVIVQAGASADMPGVDQFSDSSVQAFGGSIIVLPGVRNYQLNRAVFGQGALWQAQDANSRVEFPNLSDVQVGGPDQGDNPVMAIEALAGGVISLPALTTMIVNAGPPGPGSRDINVLADGANSLADLPVLATFSDFESGTPSTVTQSNAGTVNFPATAAFVNVVFIP